MAKKHTGLLIALGAALGAAAAGLSYYLKYKSFNDINKIAVIISQEVSEGLKGVIL